MEEMQEFEERLKHMEKPMVDELKHQDVLANAIAEARNRSLVSWWWLGVSLYVLVALFMKTLFVPHETLTRNLHEFATRDGWLSILVFLILPGLSIAMNLPAMLRIYREAGKPQASGLLRIVWLNVVIVLVSIIVIFIYL
ncbi:MAG TPA: hypothetical protein VLX91_17200 [Candidatus Acidoferrales bacterium]|nr:hypothetical protein [Candidatus Acidoferrales bacterium]